MSRSTITRLSRALAELKARRVAKEAPQIVAAELCAIGCHATAWGNESNQGVTVDSWDSTPELDAARERKLAELEAKGISAFVVVIDRLEDRLDEQGTLGSGDRVGGGGLLDGATTAPGPVSPRSNGQRERAQTPPAKHGRNDV